jgi:hypothetical protein
VYKNLIPDALLLAKQSHWTQKRIAEEIYLKRANFCFKHGQYDDAVEFYKKTIPEVLPSHVI